MLLIPAIDLKDGRCVRLKQGDMDQSTIFSEDPAAMARARAPPRKRAAGLGSSRTPACSVGGTISSLSIAHRVDTRRPADARIEPNNRHAPVRPYDNRHLIGNLPHPGVSPITRRRPTVRTPAGVAVSRAWRAPR